MPGFIYGPRAGKPPLKLQGFNLLHWQETQGGTTDIFQFFSEDARRVWNNSVKIASQRIAKTKKLNKETAGQKEFQVTADDLVLSLLEDKSVELVFWRLGINPKDIKTLLLNYAYFNSAGLGQELEQIPFVAFGESLKLHNKSIDPLMLLCALATTLPKEHILQAVFFNINLTTEEIEIISSWVFNLKLLSEDLNLFFKLSKYKPDNEVNKGLTAVPTFYLDRFGQDLTLKAKHGALPVALGRGMDLHEIFKLVSSGNRNLLIKGQEGTGRTTLVNELAYKMATDQVPKMWQDKRLISLEISAIMGSRKKPKKLLSNASKRPTSRTILFW